MIDDVTYGYSRMDILYAELCSVNNDLVWCGHTGKKIMSRHIWLHHHSFQTTYVDNTNSAGTCTHSLSVFSFMMSVQSNDVGASRENWCHVRCAHPQSHLASPNVVDAKIESDCFVGTMDGNATQYSLNQKQAQCKMPTEPKEYVRMQWFASFLLICIFSDGWHLAPATWSHWLSSCVHYSNVQKSKPNKLTAHAILHRWPTNMFP